MKPLLFSFLFFVPFALGARYYFVCDTLHWCDRESLAAAAPVRLTVAMPDGRDRQLDWSAYGEHTATLPRSTAHAAALDSLAVLAKAETDYALRIDAPVLAREGYGKRYDRYADLGIARAAAIAAELQARGVPAERLSLQSYLATGAYALVPMFSFQPVVPKSISEGLPEGDVLVDSFALRGLRFAANSTALQPDEAFMEYAGALVAALNAQPGLRLTLIGHTDDRATPGHNDSLGRWRAEAVARYLEQLGLARPAEVQSMGAREPIGDNATAEGRYLNRRVEARIE